MKKRRPRVYKYSLSTSEGNWHMPALGVRTRHFEGPTLAWLQQLPTMLLVSESICRTTDQAEFAVMLMPWCSLEGDYC